MPPSPTTDVPLPQQGRTYKSRKQRPCDACRRRKICCIREPGSLACSLCTVRSMNCTYQSQPNVRRRRPRTATTATATSLSSTRATSPQAAQSTIATSDCQSDSPPDDWTSLFVGFSSDQDPYVLRHCRFNNGYYQRQDWACMRIYGNNDVPMHFTTVPDAHLDSDVTTLRCPPLDTGSELHKSLMESYFDVVHTSYPIMDGEHTQTILEKYPPLVGIMYRLASPFTDTGMENTWLEWYDYLHRVLLWHSRYPRLATIELSLLIMCRPNSIHRVPTLPGVWPQIGSLVGMCHELGLNMDPTQWSIPSWERSRRIRLWWAVFMADKWHALGLGRPSYIHDDQWNVPMVSERDIPRKSFDGRTLPLSSTRLFIAMSVLTTILSDLLCKAYTVRSIGNERPQDTETLRMFDNFFQRLERFHEDHIKGLENPTDQVRDPTGTLHLAFFTMQVVLYRAVLRRMSPICQEAIQLRQGARQVCQNIINFVECLQVSRLRAFWWSPLSRTNFAIAGSFMCNMLLTSTEDEEVNVWTNQLTRYRTLLGMHSESFDITKLAVKRLALISSVGEPETLTRQSRERMAVDATGPTPPDLSDLPMSFDQDLDFLLDFTIPDEFSGSFPFREDFREDF